MLKRFSAAMLFLAVMCSVSWGYDINTNYNPYYLYPNYVDDGDDWTQYVYSRYGNSDIGFLYQLRDVTGASRSEQVAGPQWFATVFENYYYYFHYPEDETHAGMYRRTMGGESPTVPFSVVGDVIDGFNFVHAEEPQPYESWMRRGLINTSLYDPYPDPVESIFVVLPEGQGDFAVRFANPYARHFPFWWGWGVDTTANPRWWDYYDWREYGYVTADPINYIAYDNTVYERGIDRRYTEKYKYVLSEDISGDVVLKSEQYILDASGATVYTVSGDINGYHAFYDTDKNLAYTVSGDEVYNSSGNLAFTIEHSTNGAEYYVCEVRNIAESITFDTFDGYSVNVSPASEQSIASGNYLDARIRFRADDSYGYGSKLGYITFRQRASFATGYSNYREFTTIPIVVANVSNGNASENPLNFDMIVFGESGDVINRIKFTWDAQQDMPDQDLGTFFMMRQYNSSMPTYNLETRITNNTGTRYELFRYDQYGATRYTSPDVEYRQQYASIKPAHWKYNLTQDLYGTLPDTFMLDAHSQIAPGLVTVYKNDVYGTVNMENDTSESFRLYEYASPSPKNLRLNYRRIAGMITAGAPVKLSNDIASTQGFRMQFTDIIRNDEETEYELTNLMGKAPAMVDAADSAVAPSNTYIGSTALNAFRIIKDVPEALQAIVSYDEVVSAEPEPENPDEPVENPEEPAENPEEPAAEQEPEQEQEAPAETADFRASVEYTTDKAALQPVAIRLRIPRQSQLLVNRWEELDAAANARELFTIFSRFGTVWVRSSATAERDANLFTAINNKGSSLGVSAADCVRAFTYDNALYLDFIIVMADAVSKNNGKTAFVEVFKDDNVPYVLIGDGNIDKRWELEFYVGATGSNPDTRVTEPASPDVSNNANTEPEPENNGSNSNSVGSSGGGGGCSLGLAGLLGMMLVIRKLYR